VSVGLYLLSTQVPEIWCCVSGAALTEHTGLWDMVLCQWGCTYWAHRFLRYGAVSGAVLTGILRDYLPPTSGSSSPGRMQANCSKCCQSCTQHHIITSQTASLFNCTDCFMSNYITVQSCSVNLT